jgi:soluble lytic murein transglycosylase-like protein
LRLPKRSRGVVLGLTTLILGPILALTLVTAVPAVSRTSAVTAAHIRVRTHFVAEQNLQENRATIRPTLLAAPAPTARPAAKPRPVVHPVHPVIAAPPAPAGSIIAIIEAAAARWGVSGSWMVAIARCESGLRPTAYNPSGPYIGLFQFLPSTFAGNGGTNIYDPTDQANIAAKMLAHGQAYQWSCA